MNFNIQGWAGIYLYEANIICLSFNRKSLDSELSEIDAIKRNGPLEDWRRIQHILCYKHEQAHFTDFLISPYLNLIDYLNEFYASCVAHVSVNWPSTEIIKVSRPLLEYAENDRLNDSCKNHIYAALHLSLLRDYLLFKPTRVDTLLASLNGCIRLLAESKGLKKEATPKISSRLKRDDIVGDSITTSNIVESLGRCAEYWTLCREFNATIETCQDWANENIFGQYAPAYLYVFKRLTLLYGTIALTLCLQGKFFPFIESDELFLEDFHPVILLKNIVAFMQAKLANNPLRKIENKVVVVEEDVKNLIEETKHKFNLVSNPIDFKRNFDSLHINFHLAFPEIANSPHRERKVKEQLLLQERREEWYTTADKNPLQRHLKSSSLIFFKDGMRGPSDFLKEDNEAYLHNEAHMHLMYLQTLLQLAIGDYVIFGDKKPFKLLKNIFSFWDGINEKEILNFFGIKEIYF